MGYTYIGDTSMYRLTIPEMARLRRGYESRLRRSESGDVATDSGLTRVESGGLSPRAHGSRLRESDVQALERFEGSLGDEVNN